MPAAARDESESAPMLKSTRCSSERRALHSTIAVVGQHERGTGTKEGGARERADGADRDRSPVVHFDRKRLAEADENDERDQCEDVVARAQHDSEHACPDADEGNEADHDRKPP